MNVKLSRNIKVFNLPKNHGRRCRTAALQRVSGNLESMQYTNKMIFVKIIIIIKIDKGGGVTEEVCRGETRGAGGNVDFATVHLRPEMPFSALFFPLPLWCPLCISA